MSPRTIDLLIVISMCAAVAIPTQPSPQQGSNESNAIWMLRSLARRQAQFRQARHIDEDLDGTGEYGSLGELSGITNLMRHGIGIPSPLSPPLLPFKTIGVPGFAVNSGYLFVVYLPSYGAPPWGLRDVPLGGPDPTVDPNNCEQLWCAYAWPVVLSTTGKRAFFVNQTGAVLQTEMNACQYSGSVSTPPWSAALTAPAMNAPIALWPMYGCDANTWTAAP